MEKIVIVKENSMGLICACFIFLICYITFLIDRKKTNPVFLYSFFWGIMTFLSSLHLYSYYKVESSTYLLIFCGVFCFALGSLLGEKFCFSLKKQNVNYTLEVSEIRYIILIIVALFCLNLNFKLMGYSLKQGLSVERIYSVMAQANSNQVKDLQPLLGGVQEQLQQYLGYPLLYLIIAFSIARFVYTKKRKYLLVMVLFFLIKFLTDMRRTLLVNIAFFFVIYSILMNEALIEKIGKKVKQIYNNKIKMVLMILVIIIVFTIISILRKSGDGHYSLFYNFYSYYPGSINYLDYRIKNWKDMNMGYTYGFTSLRGVLAPFIAFLELIFKVSEPELFKNATDVVVSLHNITANISPTQRYNTYATVFYEFYADGGWGGIVIASLIFGYIAGVYYRRYKKDKSLRNIMNYGYFISMFILFSNIHINSIVIYYIWPLLMERFLYKKNKKDV